MSYESKVHKAQIEILRSLLFHSNESWSGLVKSTGLEPDHAKFHLVQLMESGLVCKSGTKYQLTVKGKEYANRLDTEAKVIEKQPKLSFVILVERKSENGVVEYLRQQGLKHPYYGYWGSLTGKVKWGESLLEGAERELLEETGLKAELELRMIMRKRDYSEETGELLEDKMFMIVHGIKPNGELIVDFEGGHNEWLSMEALGKKEKLYGGIFEVVDLINSNKELIYIERSYVVKANDY